MWIVFDPNTTSETKIYRIRLAAGIIAAKTVATSSRVFAVACTVLHYTALPCTVPHYTSLHCNSCITAWPAVGVGAPVENMRIYSRDHVIWAWSDRSGEWRRQGSLSSCAASNIRKARLRTRSRLPCARKCAPNNDDGSLSAQAHGKAPRLT